MTAKLPDDFYDKIKPRLHERIARELHSARNLLDLGCGDCALVRRLADSFDRKVTGVDVSGASFPDYKRIAKNSENVRCIRQDAVNLKSFYGAMDAVVIMWALHEMQYPQKVLRQAYRALRPGGKILIVEFPKDSLAQRLWNENYYNRRQIASLLRRAEFENIQTKLIERRQILWADAAAAAHGKSIRHSNKTLSFPRKRESTSSKVRFC